jgi:hypothetical protein
MTRTITVLLCLGVAVAAPRAHAQNPQSAPPGVVPAPVAPPGAPSPPPEKIEPGAKDSHAGGGTLSDQLTQQHGTLDPPHGVDPGMAITPPAQGQGSMPVIPPPGSPGGTPRVVPK